MITSLWTPVGGTKQNNKISIRITFEVAQNPTVKSRETKHEQLSSKNYETNIEMSLQILLNFKEKFSTYNM